MLLLPLPPLFCKVPIVYATHWRHKALICLLQISDVARFRLMWGNPEQSWVLDNTRTGFQIRCQWNLDSGFLKLNSWFQSPRFRIPQAKNPACLNPDYLSWGDMIQGWILREGVGRAHPPPPHSPAPFQYQIQLVFCIKKSLCLICVGVEHGKRLTGIVW